MSDERDTLNVGANGTSVSRTTGDDRREAVVESREQKRARLVSVINRGVVADRLHVPLPPDKYGEWVRNDPLEIARLQNIGYEVDTQYAAARALNSDGSNGAIVGDLIFMVTDRETKELIDEIRNEQFMAANGTKDQREDIEFKNAMRAGGGELDATVSSRTSVVRKDEIIAALSVNK